HAHRPRRALRIGSGRTGALRGRGVSAREVHGGHGGRGGGRGRGGAPGRPHGDGGCGEPYPGRPCRASAAAAAGTRGTPVWVFSSMMTLIILSAPWWLRTSAVGWPAAGRIPNPKSLLDLGTYFLTLGAFTIGGGLTMIAFIQDQVVGQFGWLTPREFIDGLALGQLTPRPVLMIAAYVGYKVAGIAGATVAAVAAFLPSFVIMLVILPVLDRVRQLAWMRAVMKGMGPAVIGVLAVSLVRL